MANHTGYNKTFLGKTLSLPAVPKKLCARVKENGNEIMYTHFSLFLHKTRMLPIMAAVNISGEAYSAAPREGNEPWDYSDQVDKSYQMDNRFYSNDENTFDRGHIVRRVDPCWGPPSISVIADKETFNWANCTPQHKKLNQRGGAWFELEQHVMENGVKNKMADICVFSGPVLDPNDKIFKKQYQKKDVQIPVQFFKIIVWKKSNGKLYAVGFLMSQWEWIKDSVKALPRAALRAKPKLEDNYFEKIKFKNHATYQVPISEIEKLTGIKFNWKNVTFPYRKKQPAKITAQPLQKIISTRTVTELKEIKSSKSTSRLRGLNQRLATETIGKQRSAILVATGQGALIKRYSLRNITL